MNPNLPARTYFCDGHWKIVGPSANAALDISMGGDDTAFQEMIRLNHTGYYADLLQSCQAQIRSAPEWLTPRLFCSLAYLGAGDMANAKTMLREFDSRTGPAYDAGACKQMSGLPSSAPTIVNAHFRHYPPPQPKLLQSPINGFVRSPSLLSCCAGSSKHSNIATSASCGWAPALPRSAPGCRSWRKPGWSMTCRNPASCWASTCFSAASPSSCFPCSAA